MHFRNILATILILGYIDSVSKECESTPSFMLWHVRRAAERYGESRKIKKAI